MSTRTARLVDDSTRLLNTTAIAAAGLSKASLRLGWASLITVSAAWAGGAFKPASTDSANHSAGRIRVLVCFFRSFIAGHSFLRVALGPVPIRAGRVGEQAFATVDIELRQQ